MLDVSRQLRLDLQEKRCLVKAKSRLDGFRSAGGACLEILQKTGIPCPTPVREVRGGMPVDQVVAALDGQDDILMRDWPVETHHGCPVFHDHRGASTLAEGVVED